MPRREAPFGLCIAEMLQRMSPFMTKRTFRERVPMSAFGGGLNRSAQHSNLLAEMECEHEAATSHLLFCGSAV